MSTNTMYDLSLNQTANAILHGGKKRTVLVQGHMGTGKSSLLKMLAEMLPDHVPCYFDCTTKDLGDISIPDIQRILDDNVQQQYVTFLPNEELGIHYGKPIILMVDEFGKANRPVQNAMLRVFLERNVNGKPLPEGSIVFATTNLGAENVGDLMLPHHYNRITVVRSRKPNNIEWLSNFAIPNNLHPALLSWVKDTPELFHSFEDVNDPDDNQYIFHPRAKDRTAFVTPRSLEATSDWLYLRNEIDDKAMTGLLIGTIGPRAAMDLMAYVRLADQLPSLDSIKNDPENALVPDSTAAICMVVYRTLSNIEREWLDNWMVYMNRLPAEAQAIFANGVRHDTYNKRGVVLTQKSFMDWAMNNNHLFAADKR